MAKRLMRVGGSGRIVFDYDMRIAEPIHASADAPPFDMWPAFRALAGRPVLALRGELSDILSDLTLARMADAVPGLDAITVPDTGHPTTLEETESKEGMARLLARVA